MQTLNVDLSPKETKVLQVLSPKKNYRKKRIFFIFLGVFLLFIGIGLVLGLNNFYLPLRRVMDSVDKIKLIGSSMFADFEKKNLSNIDLYFEKVSVELSTISKELDGFDFLNSLEFTKGYYNNFQIFKEILFDVDFLVESTLPKLKNVLKVSGFKVGDELIDENFLSNQSEEESQGALTLILKEMPEYISLYKEVEPQIISILEKVKLIDLDYIPDLFGGEKLKKALDESYYFIEEFPLLSGKIIGFVEFLPELIGVNEPTTYLIFLQSISELRASGGLITAFGNVTLNKGEFQDTITLEDSWNLEIYVAYELGIFVGYENIYGQKYLMNAGCGATWQRFQDAGDYPDLFVSMNKLKDYYDVAKTYDKTRFPEYDHILMLNDTFAENILSLIQPLEVEGYGVVTAETLYNFIKAETDDPKNAWNPGRKDIIKDIANAAKKNFLELSISDFPKVIEIFYKSILAKDLAFSSPNNIKMQEFFDLYGMSGRTVNDFTSDYFQLSEAQNCSLKLNNWVRNTVEHTVNILDDGTFNRNVRVIWTQPKIYDDSIPYGQYDTTTRFIYRAWVRLLMPKDTNNIFSDGYYKSGYLYYWPQTYYDKFLDKKVSDNIIAFDHRRFSESDPVRGIDLNVSYTLPSSINYNEQKKYSLVLQKHSGKSWGELHKIIINYKGREYKTEIVLDRDKILSFSNGVIIVDNLNTSLDWIMDITEKIDWEKFASTRSSEKTD